MTVMDSVSHYRACDLCPHLCGVDRLQGELGYCGECAQLRIASIGAHFGEEPPISGQYGSGTVFFSGCHLQCDFCQNHQISREHLGQNMNVMDVVDRLEELTFTSQIHNVNFVTPTHVLPKTVEIIQELRGRRIEIPAIYNMSGYERREILQELEPFADIYLPDFKYADTHLGERLSHCSNYPSTALDAIAEMLRQKGFLDVFLPGHDGAIAGRGVLQRHLILPGHIQNSLDALDMLFIEFGKELPISLMSQYHPVRPCQEPGMDQRLTAEEFQRVYDHTQELGFQHLFVQYPAESRNQRPDFLPDFRKKQPFEGNMLHSQ
ncbi:radical SAM protein [candidate division KSB3 bacterium]|uniref:Radical SAM protein n=1 Tax=candidate division KSB3 bacterium TaxID=2044937 RepID=A0A2G6EB22_9BACT|nr:MAG: radical SAM protein [candidate division KSB3 bacterium]PIE30992.1 MAG: radical SAM protein [candidate division KSB3 bacterium]